MARLDSVKQYGALVGRYPLSMIREDFPVLGIRVHADDTEERAEPGRGKPLVYLDNAATTQKPRHVLEAVHGYYKKSNANVHRAIHALGEKATFQYESSRRTVRDFLHARTEKEIVFTRGTTEAINLAAFSWGRKNLREGDRILLSEMEHHSNLVPWQILSQEKGLELRFIPLKEDGSLNMEELPGLIDETTKLVALTQMSNVLGTINDVRAVVSLAHRRDIPVLIDAAQAVPHLPLDVREMDCDFLAFSGHKLYAPMGIGVLYGRESLLEEMPPFQGGGEMIKAVWYDRAVWNELPHKFEAGTPNVGGAIGLAAAIEYLERLGMENVRRYEDLLTRYALQRLREIPEVVVYGRAPRRGSVIRFNLGDLHPHDVAQYLDAEGIAVRAGHHCAQPLHRKLGLSATLRASPSFYNTEGEVDKLVEGLRGARDFFRDGFH
jgi:cysteine desulfurase / selenocysteine lyase